MVRTLSFMKEPSSDEANWFRPLLGLFAVAAGILGLLALYFIAVPAGNMQALLLGLGIVLGWGSSVVQSEYGSTTAGRKLQQKVADAIETH